MLYLIEILHQTTTFDFRPRFSPGCILSKFYIKPQHLDILQFWRDRCILSKFYIKPQHAANNNMNVCRCILSKFYIKPQHSWRHVSCGRRCILSKFYIKPQQRSLQHDSFSVVSYRNSTSNHNSLTTRYDSRGLYLIEILHQTTTNPSSPLLFCCCILSKFYIKPQQRSLQHDSFSVVSYRNSTSNHNSLTTRYDSRGLYLIEILHQTTTNPSSPLLFCCCILSKFYIKPQHGHGKILNTQSCILSKFYIKPQLRLERELTRCSCILSKFYIKPQQRRE